MPTFYDSNKTPYVLAQEIGRGGEGTVFHCPNDSLLVAKIYHEPIDDEKKEKLCWMAANRNDQLLKVAAWIVDTLHDRNGNVVGFLMPNVKAKEIHELYSLKSRRVHFPEANWQFLIHAAANVARAFYVLHKNDHIMGDVNHGNCVVLADGTVKLIDCDSYSIKTDKMRYRCEVGVATHLAPELQGIDLSEVEREKKHDNFGLAVIIFQLLFLGRHPFAGNYLGAEDKSLEDCIRERRFAYGNQELTNVKQPPGTLSLSQVSVRVAMMFERAFMMDDRPEPREWIEALEDLSDSLRQCAAHIGHHYFQELQSCPWCAIESKTGLMLFPFVSKDGNSETGLNIFTIENLLASLDIPKNLPTKPLKSNVLPTPSPEAFRLRGSRQNQTVGFVFFHLLLVVFWTFAGGIASGVFMGLFLAFCFWAIMKYLQKDSKELLESELDESRKKWDELEREWSKLRTPQSFDATLDIVRQKIKSHQELQKERREFVEGLQKRSFRNALKLYLSTFLLSELKIDSNQLDELRHYGFTTAADIDNNRLDLINIEESTVKTLLEWRSELEKSFVFNPNTALLDISKNKIELEFTETRRNIEREIDRLISTVRSGAIAVRQNQKQLLAKSQAIAEKLLQAESNYLVIGTNAMPVVAFLLVSFLVPMISPLFQTPLYKQQSNLKSTSPSPWKTPAPNYNVANNYPLVEFEGELNYPVNEKITDKELSVMSAVIREKSAKSLHLQAIKLIESKDYKNAEKKLRLAIKFTEYFTDILYTLGELLYNQNRYSESVKFLEKSLVIDSENEPAKVLLGANYLRMNRYDEADIVFSQVLNKNPNSFAANYNLGLINEKQNYYNSAKYRFEKAIEAAPNDIDANYEYGICLYKTGDIDGATRQYKRMLNLNKVKAEALRKLIGADPVYVY